MVANQTELNKLFQLKTKIRFLSADLWFLRKCKSMKVFPKFMFVKSPRNMNNCFKDECIFQFKRCWLEKCIQNYYNKLAEVEASAYQLHLKIIADHQNWSDDLVEWHLWCTKTNIAIDRKVRAKNSTLVRKLGQLSRETQPSLPVKAPQLVTGYVKNLSSQVLSEGEEQFLNKGLNFALPNKTIPVVDIISELEVAISTIPREDQNTVRTASKKILQKCIATERRNKNDKSAIILRSLKNKDCVYVKADKGNALVILDREDYISRVENLICEGPYVEVKKNPLPTLDRKANEIRLGLSKVFNKNLQFKLKISNPRIPRLYALPKIHKEGNKMRPIVSNINSPLENISKWLVDEFNKIPRLHSFEIKNSFELVRKLENVELQDNEILVSFDVAALFPSVPIEKTLEIVENWLLKNKISAEKISLYLNATRLCMKESFFQFNDKFYKQTNGTSMGNSLSPFIANIFMAHFETSLSENAIFPRVWIRYVDDVCAIIKKQQLRSINKLLNSQYDTIKFTHEEEVDGKLPFLDLELIRNDSNKIDFSIYRKSTTTDRFITSDSFHPKQHKIAAFHSMVHRMENIPLSKPNYEKEKAKIIEIASVNGFDRKIIDKLIKTAKRKKSRRDITTLTPVSENNLKWFKISFHPGLSDKLANQFRKHNIKMVPSSNNKLSKFLTNIKDKIPPLAKSGVYEIKCNDCDKKYIGSSKRQIQTRFKEHLNLKNIDKSAIANHIFETNHKITIDNLSLLHEVRDNRKIEIVESYYIQNTNDDNLINNDNGPVISSLFQVKK